MYVFAVIDIITGISILPIIALYDNNMKTLTRVIPLLIALFFGISTIIIPFVAYYRGLAIGISDFNILIKACTISVVIMMIFYKICRAIITKD